MGPRSRHELALAALCFGGALLLYLRTLAPGVVALDDDSLEFQLLAQRGGIAHPTGYPLYTILLWLASRLLPIGEVATRANLLSALIAAATVALTFLVARRSGTGRGGALVAAALLAVAPTFWAQATLAEVYPLHLFIVAALVLALLRVEEKGPSALPVVALLVGLGLAHHRMILLWLPAALLFVALAAPGLLRPQRAWLPALGALVLPLSLYLWLPLRAEVGSVDGTYSTVGFSCWVRACQYEESFFGRDNALAQRVPPSFYLDLTAREIGALGIALAALGLVALARARSRVAALLGAGLLVNALFAMNYVVPDREVFWLPTLWGLALLAGWGVEGLTRLVMARLPNRRVAALLFPIIALAWVAGHGAATFPAADRSAITMPTLAGEAINGFDMLAQPLPENAVVVGLLGEIAYLQYLQEARGLAPDIATAGGDSEEARWAALERALATGRRPFLTRPLARAEARGSLAALGPLIELRAAPMTALPEGMWPVSAPMGAGITLEGWLLSPVAGSEEVRLTFAWRAAGPTAEALSLSVRALDAAGNPVTSRDRPPLRGAYPTTAWRAGEIVQDTHEISPAPPGGSFLIILYRASNGGEVGRATLFP